MLEWQQQQKKDRITFRDVAFLLYGIFLGTGAGAVASLALASLLTGDPGAQP